jgi:hypothetical protein
MNYIEKSVNVDNTILWRLIAKGFSFVVPFFDMGFQFLSIALLGGDFTFAVMIIL